MSEKCLTSVTLEDKHICFLDKLSKECKFSGGRKLRRAAILRALLKAGTKLNIDVSAVRSEEQLKKRIFASFKGG